jgi:hypothetical protein
VKRSGSVGEALRKRPPSELPKSGSALLDFGSSLRGATLPCWQGARFCTPERASEIQKRASGFLKLAPGVASMENPLGAGLEPRVSERCSEGGARGGGGGLPSTLVYTRKDIPNLNLNQHATLDLVP